MSPRLDQTAFYWLGLARVLALDVNLSLSQFLTFCCFSMLVKSGPVTHERLMPVCGLSNAQLSVSLNELKDDLGLICGVRFLSLTEEGERKKKSVEVRYRRMIEELREQAR